MLFRFSVLLALLSPKGLADAALQTMITEIAPKFQLFTFEDAETDTSLPSGGCAGEHMTSFDYAYKLGLFAQSK